MKINIREKENVVILDLEGNIDINSSDLIETIGWVLQRRAKDILCNFEGINLIDYIGVSVLAIIYKNVLNRQGNLKLYNVPGHVKKLFSIVGLDKVLECYMTEERGLYGFKEEKIISKIMEEKLRRRFKRIPFRNPIEYKQKFASKDIFYKGKIINLSPAGAFVIGEKVFSIGELLSAKLHLLPKPGIIEVDTKVIWASDKNIHPLEYPAMGIEFHNISTKKQQSIVDFVEKHSAGSNV